MSDLRVRSSSFAALPRHTSPLYDARMPQFAELCLGAELILSFCCLEKLLRELFSISHFRSFWIMDCY
jgi:hypothetical protein